MEQQQTGGPGYDIPCYDLPILPSPYSGRSGGPGYDIPCHDLPMSPPSYSGHSGGPDYDIPCSSPQYNGSHCYRSKPFVRRYSGGDGTALSPQQQTTSSYSGRSGGPGYDIPCSLPQYSSSHRYRAKPSVRHYIGGDTVQHCRRSSSQAPAPSIALSGTRDTTAASVQRRSSSQPHAPSLALFGTIGTTAATVQRRSSSQLHAPSLALSGTRGTTAAIVQRRSSSQALYRHATSDDCNHLAGPSHRQPSLSRTRPLRSGFSRTIWRC